MFFHSLYGYNLLLVACNRPPNAGTLTTIRLLLEVGADANVTDNKGNSPLHHVVRWTREASEYVSPIATLLLKHGALPHQCNSSNETPLDLWTMHKRETGDNPLSTELDVDDCDALGLVERQIDSPEQNLLQEAACPSYSKVFP